MISFLVGLVVVIMAGFYDRLVVLWIGRPIPEVGNIIFLLLLGYTVAVILTGTGSSVCKGMGIVRIETIYIIVGLVINVLLKIILVPFYGAMGTLASSAISWSVSSIVFVVLLHKQTKIPLSSTMKAVKTLFIVAVCILIARWITTIWPVETERLPALYSLLKLGVPLALMYMFLMVIFDILPWDELLSCGQSVKAKIVNICTKG
jgi:O-antigen/teichoic acid export membrane protein